MWLYFKNLFKKNYSRALYQKVKMNAHWGFIPVKIKLEKGVNLKNQYVIISNHFSFIDIPALAALNIPFKFIGKIAVNNIPLLGYIFKNLHIFILSLLCLFIGFIIRPSIIFIIPAICLWSFIYVLPLAIEFGHFFTLGARLQCFFGLIGSVVVLTGIISSL